MFDVTWRKNGTSFVISGSQQSWSVFPQGTWCATRSFYDFRFQSYGSKGDFPGSRYVWPWPWHFKVIWFLRIHIVPLHDWCKFWSDMFINSGDIAHWNMEKLPMLYNGNFRCHGNVCYAFRISPILHIPSDRSKHYVCGKNRLNIDDFRRFHKSTISHR